MKRVLFRFNLLFVLLLLVLQPAFLQHTDLELRLKEIDGIIEIERINTRVFQEAFKIGFLQPVNHENESEGYFIQKVYLSHRDFNRPVIFDTDGYVLRQNLAHELSMMLQTNQIRVEHRYFGESVPDSVVFNWRYLDIYQSARDHHRVVNALRQLYQGKWIGTGISKGGQTAMNHRRFFPDDVDITVAYVAPLNFSDEDVRVEEFLRQVGTDECRDKVLEFQKVLLERREEVLPLFERYVKAAGLEFRLSQQAIYELAVLEFPVSFWQWGHSCASVPGSNAPSDSLFLFFSRTGSIDFLDSGPKSMLEPAFYQFFTQLGFYGYSTEGLENHLIHLNNPSLFFLGPQEVKMQFNPFYMKDIENFIQNRAERMIWIYGEIDPWSATLVDPGMNENVKVFIKPGGSHSTRINNLPEGQKEEVLSLIREWLERDVNPSISY
jgi:hypothetical protein